MNLGLSVVIFLAIAIVVMALFCLVTRHFNKKLEQALEDQNQVYSMIQQIRGKDGNQEEDDGQYENYMNLKERNQAKKSKVNQPFQLELTQVKEPLKGLVDNIYGMGKLRRRLEGQPNSLNPETGRSMGSVRSFKPQRLESKRATNNLSNRSKSTDSNQDISEGDPMLSKRTNGQKKKKQNIVTHVYINKIVAYIVQGIFVIQNDVKAITKRSKIEQKRTIKKIDIKPDQNSFLDSLQAYGFEKGQFCAFKFETTLQIPNMKDGQQYPVSALKSSESKQGIEFAQYYILKDKLQEQL